MPRHIDHEVLRGFIDEALGYLPRILEGIDRLHRDPESSEHLEETHRLTHSIKGAAGMLGLPGLANIAYLLEEALEQVAAGQLAADADTVEALSDTAASIGRYLDQLHSGTLVERPLIERAVTTFRRLRQLPEAGDAAEIDRLCPPAEDGAPTLEDSGASATSGPRSTGSIAEVPPPAPAVDTPLPAPAPTAIPFVDDEEPVSPDLLDAFRQEALDHLGVAGEGLRALEAEPGSAEALRTVQRSIHTLKGAAAMVGHRKSSELAHRMEDLLDALQADGAAPDGDQLELLFSTAEALEDLATGTTVEPEILDALYGRYQELLGASSPRPTAPRTEDPATDDPLGTPLIVDLSANEAATSAVGTGASAARDSPAATAGSERRDQGPVVRVPIARLDEVVRLMSELVVSTSTFERYFQQMRREVGELGLSSERLRQLSHRIETEYEAFALTGTQQLVAAGGGGLGGGGAAWSTGSFQDFDELELDRYTELHRVSRQLSEGTNDLKTLESGLGHRLGDFEGYLNRVGRLTGEIQDKLMRLRMVPLAQLSSRLHRTVRVTARDQQKQVDLVFDGEDTALDKTVLETLGDPLLHLLRNAVDHGIEPPALRRVLGKDERGRIQLRARHQGTQVILEISDDGGGLDEEALRARAVETGRLTETEAAEARAETLYPMIFEPGFTTTSEVSEVSGRGVGLDVVQSVIHGLEGTLGVRSVAGQGVTFTIRLPLTLAVVRAILVRSGEHTYALPLAPVRQILRLDTQDLETLGHESMVRVRDRAYPAVRLRDALGLQGSDDDEVRRAPALILDLGEHQVALLVDRIVEARDIVVKNLGGLLRRTPAVTGATLLGDGSVVLILDPQQLAGTQEAENAPLPAALPAPPKTPRAESRRPLEVMVVDDSVSVRRVLSNLLKAQGWNPITARDGLEALETLQGLERLPDAMLLDIEMPRMDGYELTTTLRGRNAYADLPIVMLTSRAGEKHRRRAFEAGATEYLVKPYQDAVLLQMLRRLTRSTSGDTPTQ